MTPADKEAILEQLRFVEDACEREIRYGETYRNGPRAQEYRDRLAETRRLIDVVRGMADTP